MQSLFFQTLDALGRAVWTVVGNEHSAGQKRRIAHGVKVADHNVGAVPGLEQRVGACVNADEQRTVFPNVGLEHCQVLFVVVPGGYDQRLAFEHRFGDVRQVECAEEEVGMIVNERRHVVDEVGDDPAVPFFNRFCSVHGAILSRR